MWRFPLYEMLRGHADAGVVVRVPPGVWFAEVISGWCSAALLAEGPAAAPGPGVAVEGLGGRFFAELDLPRVGQVSGEVPAVEPFDVVRRERDCQEQGGGDQSGDAEVAAVDVADLVAQLSIEPFDEAATVERQRPPSRLPRERLAVEFKLAFTAQTAALAAWSPLTCVPTEPAAVPHHRPGLPLVTAGDRRAPTPRCPRAGEQRIELAQGSEIEIFLNVG